MTAQDCRTVSLGGRDVAEVCFKSGELSFHFYVMPMDAMSERETGETPTLVAQASKAAAGWSDGRRLYVLARYTRLDAV
jgi:hypothetical protein